jgi:hypothetical protein
MDDHPALRRMQLLLEQWDLSLDARAIFLRCYAMMTDNMQTAVQAGEFEDSAWVAALLEYFSHYYFAALEACERGTPGAPPVWRVAFTAAGHPGTHAWQNLALGVNAHINYDLVFAVADMLEGEWAQLDAEGRQGRYRDFCKVNELINRTINAVQDEVLEQWSPGMRLVDDLLGPVDEWIVVGMLAEWREQVWEQAIRRVEQPMEDERGRLRQQVEAEALRRARAILGEEGLSGYLGLL